MIKRYFDPVLVNGPEGDPALYVERLGEGRSFLFDLGRIDRLKPAEIFRLTHVFVSHTHVDHFIGFDQLLRLRIGHAEPLRLLGPAGFIDNVQGKLSAYTWNLVEGQSFEIVAEEFEGGRIRSRRFRARDAFRPSDHVEEREVADGIVADDGILRVASEILDHRIPSLAFAAMEKERVNVDSEALRREGFKPGEWLGDLKRAVEAEVPESTEIRVDGTPFTVGTLKERLLLFTPGDKLAYVADAGFTDSNAEKIVRLAEGADHFFCEGGFLHADMEKAHDNFHLTAHEAGKLARRAGVKQLTPFHFSPKYMGRFQELGDEARDAFESPGD